MSAKPATPGCQKAERVEWTQIAPRTLNRYLLILKRLIFERASALAGLIWLLRLIVRRSDNSFCERGFERLPLLPYEGAIISLAVNR